MPCLHVNFNKIFIIQAITCCIFIDAVAQVSMVDGQSSTSIQIAPGTKLEYYSDIAVQAGQQNEKADLNWCGLGWRFGYPSIIVVHNSTVSLDDDSWFFDDGLGNRSEIIRVFEGNPSQEKFYFKNNPIQKIIPIDNSPIPPGQYRVIKGWQITLADGTFNRYGCVAGYSDDAAPYLPRWGNYITKGGVGSPAPEKYYYRWYLKEIEDINGKKTFYTYNNITGTTSTGFTYIREIYPQQVVSPLDGKILFVLSQNPRSVNEGCAEPPQGEFDFTQTYFLRNVIIKDNDNRVLENVNLTYSGDLGEVEHLKHDKKGFAKRLLTRVRYTTEKGKDQLFKYDPITGHLLTIMQPEAGSALNYTYADKTFPLWRDLESDFALSDYDNTNIVSIGNHIYCMKTPSGAQLELEIFDKVGNEWKRTEIPGITGNLFTNGAKFYPYLDRFVIQYKTDNYHSEIRIFQWIDNNWQVVYGSGTGSSSPIDLEKTTFKHAQNYVLKYNPNLTASENIYVIGKIANSEYWGQLAAFAAVDGGAPKVEAARDYFLYSFRGTYDGVAGYRQVEVYRNDGSGWVQHNLNNRVVYHEGTNDCEMFAFDDYFIVKEASVGATDIAIRRWNAATSQFTAEYFENTDLDKNTELGSFNWPRACRLFMGIDYAVLIEPNDDGWMMIYRYLNQGSGNYSWQRTYIAATGTCSAPTVQGAQHAFNGTQYPYAKNFQHSSGRVYISYAQCSDRHFFVVGFRDGANYLWDFRWTGDEQGPTETGWVSKINGHPAYETTGHDISCQGLKLDNLRTVQATYTNTDNIGVYMRMDDGAYVHWVFPYDFENGKYGHLMLNTGGDQIKVDQSNDLAVQLWNSSYNSKQVIIVHERYLGNFTSAPNVKAVGTVTTSDAMGNQVSSSYGYTEGKQLFDNCKGTGLYSLVSSWTGDGTKSGKITTEFSLDSSTGVFGQVFAISQHKASAATILPDDTVRISGWLMELDGYTPKAGWISAGYHTGPSTIVRIDPQTGYFQAKLYNPSQDQFGLWHVATSDGNGYSPVFWLNKSGSLWRLDYAGREGSLPYAPSNPYNWQNVKINYGLESGKKKTVWNLSRRPNAFGGSYSFSGVKKIPLGLYNTAIQPRLVRSLSIRDNVTTVSGTPYEYYDEHNNAPGVSYVFNSDGSVKVSKTLFAHDEFTGMGAAGAFMLAQPTGTIGYAVSNPGTADWEGGTVYTIGTTQDPYSIPILTSSLISDLKAGDKIVVAVTHRLTESNTDKSVQFRLKINSNVRASAESRNVSNTISPAQVASVEYQLQSTDMPVSNVNLVVDDIDYTLEVRKINGYIYRTLRLANDKVVSASAVTWKNSSGTWRADTSYAWNVPLNASGLPTVSLSNFVYSNPASNLANNWKAVSSIERYSSYGKPVHTAGPGRAPSTTIYGTPLYLGIASVTNAGFTECGVFTGDYKVGNHTGYWDYENGWEKGSTNTVELVSGANSHFGSKAIHVMRDYAAGRNNRIYPGKAYTMSAWVKVASGTINMATDFRYANTGYENEWPATHVTTATTPEAIWATPITATDCNGKWKLMTMQIPASATLQLDPNKVWYARAWVGNDPAQPSFEAYVDDVRFHPSDALVSSTYHDPKWLKPILQVDANNNPGQKVIFDEFGRPVEVRKIDKTNPSSTVLTESKEYHLMGDCGTPQYSNGYETGNADIDASSPDCGGQSAIVSGGYNSAHSIRVTYQYGFCTLPGKLNLTPAAFTGKMCVLKGYYKSDLDLNVGITASSDINSAGVGSAQLVATTEWTPFTIYFDLLPILWDITELTVSFVNAYSHGSGTYYFWADDMKACAVY